MLPCYLSHLSVLWNAGSLSEITQCSGCVALFSVNKQSAIVVHNLVESLFKKGNHKHASWQTTVSDVPAVFDPYIKRSNLSCIF